MKEVFVASLPVKRSYLTVESFDVGIRSSKNGDPQKARSHCSLVPKLLPVFRRKLTREPGKIHHVRDVRWKGLGAARAQFKI